MGMNGSGCQPRMLGVLRLLPWVFKIFRLPPQRLIVDYERGGSPRVVERVTLRGLQVVDEEKEQ